MSKRLLRFAPLLSIAAIAVHSGGALAQASWNTGATCTQNAGNSGSYNNSWNCASGVVGEAAMTASGWSVDRGTNVWIRQDNPATTGTNEYSRLVQATSPGTGYVNQSLSGSGFASAYLSPQGSSGFGLASRTEGINVSSPDHSIDDITPGAGDLVLLSFSSAVVLQQIKLGWSQTDADVTLLRWTGDTAPGRTTGTTAVPGTENLTDTLGTGAWVAVGNYADLTAGTATGVNAGAAGSSWWLISSYNSTLGAAAGCTDTGTGGANDGCTATNDAFKLSWVKTVAFTCTAGYTTTAGGNCTPPNNGGGSPAPEPASLALFGVAALGAGIARRRARAKAV